ncbi:MAG: FAD:protein FMN transferase [Sneathiella sp.]
MSKIEAAKHPTRRQFIVAASAVGALSVVGSPVMATEGAQLVTWKGAALGAEASIQLYHPDPKWARRQLERCHKEINRLENLFSLYRPNSSICQLNKNGSLENPDIDFVQLLSRAKAFTEVSGGAFDVTVQPLWKLYADHFQGPNADPKGPGAEVINKTIDLIGAENIYLASDRVGFLKKGMGITLNGIAQGYVTDRITQMLRDAGFDNVLVSLGEQFALGTKPDQQNWRVGIISPADGVSITKTVDLKNAAIATSGGYGSPFAPNSNLNHLIDPRTGQSAKLSKSVSVIAKNAVKADMVSTALSLMTESKGRELVANDPSISEMIYSDVL